MALRGLTNDDTTLQRPGAPWNDDPCDFSEGRGYVCEKSKENIPGATTPPVDDGCDEVTCHFLYVKQNLQC